MSDGPAGFSLADVLGMARLCLREARPAEAELAARKALLLAPAEADCHAMLSLALLDLGRLASAATAAEAALALAPRKPMLLNLPARIAARRGLYQEALRQRWDFCKPAQIMPKPMPSQPRWSQTLSCES